MVYSHFLCQSLLALSCSEDNGYNVSHLCDNYFMAIPAADRVD